MRHDHYKDRSWTVQPEAENLLWSILAERLEQCPAGLAFSQTLHEASAIRPSRAEDSR